MDNGRQKSIEVEGTNVEDAISKALKILGVSREAVEFRVVCEEKKGLFGMKGEKCAKVKATLIDKECA